MGVLHQDTTIANGASQSGVVDISDRCVLAIEIPNAWTAADVTMLAAQVVGGTFVPVKNQDGTDVKFTAAVSTLIVISPLLTKPLAFVKFRSGTAAVPVNQGGDRVINVVTLEEDRT